MPQKRRCTTPGCNSENPVFGPFGTKEKSRCKDHALETDVDVRTPKCAFNSCEVPPTYRDKSEVSETFVKGSIIPTHCYIHVDRTTHTCVVGRQRCELCVKRSSFGAKGERPSRCKEHKLEGFIYLSTGTPLCKSEGCDKMASFSFTPRPEWCMKHAPPGTPRAGTSTKN